MARPNGKIEMGLRQALYSGRDHLKTLRRRIREGDCTRAVFELWNATDAASWALGMSTATKRAGDRKKALRLYDAIGKAMWKVSDLIYDGQCRRVE